MGGDDLGSDDEYLNPSFTSGAGLVDDDEEVNDAVLVNPLVEKRGNDGRTSLSPSKKRKRDSLVDQTEVLEDSSKKDLPDRKKSSSRILLDAGRDLQSQSQQVQHKFLKTALSHYSHLRQEEDTNNDNHKLVLSNIVDLKDLSSDSDFVERFKYIMPSKKRLKKWNHIGSPMILILCVSARRAVAVLKELACFKTRAAKLFAKHMSLQEQASQLQTKSFGVAVGTPHRLQMLHQQNAFNLDKTQLVVLDAHANGKGYTVCTLPDTAPDCMKFVQDALLPQLMKRKDIKIAMI